MLTYEQLKELRGTIRHIFITFVGRDDHGNAFISFELIEEQMNLDAEVEFLKGE